jgi:hypothetical protein
MKMLNYKVVKEELVDRNGNTVLVNNPYKELNEIPSNYIQETEKYEYVVVKTTHRREIFNKLNIDQFDKIKYTFIVLNYSYNGDKYFLFNTDSLITIDAQIDLKIEINRLDKSDYE